MSQEQNKARHPALWVVSNYIAMGIPFSMVIWVSGTMFKDLGHSDSEITVPIAAIGIMWSLKPFWAGFLDIFKTKKFFVLSTEFIIGVLFALMGLALNLDGYFGAIVAIMWIVAFMSATQDICSDGIYISSLNKAQQAAYIGVQGMAWNLGRVIAVSMIVWFAGYLQNAGGMEAKTAWMYSLFGSGVMMGLFGLYHTVMLPTGSIPEEKAGQTPGEIVQDFLNSAADFCNKRALWGMLAFVFFYRSSEGLLLIEAPLFMQGCIEDGALQLALEDKGAIDGIVSTLVSIAGGLLGGVFIAKFTLKRTLFVLALCVNVPNLCYVYLSQMVSPETPLSFMEVATVVSLEKFWYGFGFVGNMLYMMQQIAPGKFKMTHYAFATAFMNLVLVPTQMVSGPLADMMGFKEFFWLVIFAAAPSLVAAWFAPFPQTDGSGEDHYIDDPELLSESEKTSQAAARRATVYSLLAVALFLFVDVLFLGWMAKTESGAMLMFFLVGIAVTTVVKLILATRAVSAGRAAINLTDSLPAEPSTPAGPTKPYLSNAKGAVWGGGIMLVISVILAGYCGRLAMNTDWGCAFSDQATACLQPDKKTPKPCEKKLVDRPGSLATGAGSQ